MNNINVLIVGVGGQGSLLAARILGTLFLKAGADVKISEVHGMAQRGGSVVTYVRSGEKVASPMVSVGEADVIIAFEALEALRWKHYLKPDGAMVVNTQQIPPLTVLTGAAKYPENIVGMLSASCKKLVALDALTPAKACGNAKATNLVLLGVASRFFQNTAQEWEAAIREHVPPKMIDLNLAAFKTGGEEKW